MIEPRLVGIAQLAVAKAPEQLCCLGLGSCIAVFMYDGHLRMGGVVHALLPKAPDKMTADSETKYANTGIRRLQRELISRGVKKERIRVKLVGGAQMFPNIDLNMKDIGADNHHAARETLKELGILVVAEDVLGRHGRSAFFNLEDGHVLIKAAFSPDKTI